MSMTLLKEKAMKHGIKRTLDIDTGSDIEIVADETQTDNV